VLIGDPGARQELIGSVYVPLASSPTLLETAAVYVELGGSLEATARALFVHPNTVRYRLRRVRDLTGWDPTDPREAFTVHVGITAGRLATDGAD
jgi:DNA-binding PucR family transcriptional regulator